MKKILLVVCIFLTFNSAAVAKLPLAKIGIFPAFCFTIAATCLVPSLTDTNAEEAFYSFIEPKIEGRVFSQKELPLLRAGFPVVVTFAWTVVGLATLNKRSSVLVTREIKEGLENGENTNQLMTRLEKLKQF